MSRAICHSTDQTQLNLKNCKGLRDTCFNRRRLRRKKRRGKRIDAYPVRFQTLREIFPFRDFPPCITEPGRSAKPLPSKAWEAKSSRTTPVYPRIKTSHYKEGADGKSKPNTSDGRSRPPLHGTAQSIEMIMFLAIFSSQNGQPWLDPWPASSLALPGDKEIGSPTPKRRP